MPLTVALYVFCHPVGTGIHGFCVAAQMPKLGMLTIGNLSILVVTRQLFILVCMLNVGLKKPGAAPLSHIISADLTIYSSS
jgi:hypothetical protein